MIEQYNKDKRKLERARQKIAILEEMIENRTRELYLKNMELEKQNEELERFAYVSSHDLQEPIRSIVGFSQLLERKYKDTIDGEAEQYLSYITEASFRISKLVSALLEYTRLGKERKIEKIDLKEKVNNILMDHARLIQDNNATIHVDNLPMIEGCEVEITQLFQNIIQNAIKFRKLGTPPLIIIKYEDTHSHWCFSIKDNGIGIDMEFKDQIFIIFKRLHTRAVYEGTGIGLSLCKKIVELHDGKIWIESEMGMGTTFFFTVSKTLTD